MDIPSEQRVRAAQRGEEAAFHELMREHQAKLYRIAYTCLGTEADALEAVQETTCRAYAQLRKLKEPRYFGTWLVRILMNYCSDEQRRQKRMRAALPEIAAASASAQPDDPSRLQAIFMDAIVQELDTRERQIIQLKYYHDMTIAEIARTLDRPEGTIKTWLNKALQGLRRRLEREGGFDA